MSGSGAEKYGRFYWCIKTGLSKETGEIYAYADEVQIDQTGCLTLIQHHDDGRRTPTLALASGSWQAFYAATALDGSAVSVEHWAGEVISPNS